MYTDWTMKLRRLVLDHNNLLVCPFVAKTAAIHLEKSFNSSWEVLHSGQRDFEPFLFQNSGQITIWCWWRNSFSDFLLL